MSELPTYPQKQNNHSTVSKRISQFQGLASSSTTISPVKQAISTNHKVTTRVAVAIDNEKSPPLQAEVNQASVRLLTQQFEQTPAKPLATRSLSQQSPALKATETRSTNKVSALTLQLQDQLKLLPSIQTNEEDIEKIRRLRAQETQEANKKAKFVFSGSSFDPKCDGEHPYFKRLFDIKKKQLLGALDSALVTLLHHGPTKCIVEELFKKEVAAIDLVHPSLRDLSDSFKRIATIAAQYREFFLAIEEHEREPQVALPESLQEMGWLNGLITVLKVTYNKPDSETLSKVRYEIKSIYGKNLSELPRLLPQNPSLLSDVFAIFIKETTPFTQFTINNILLSVLTFESNPETRFSGKEIVLIDALRFILTKPDYPLTNSDRRNISLNALFLYSQLVTNTVTDIPLDKGQAIVVIYLLQQHRYREITTPVNEKNEIYQRLSCIVELSDIIDNKPTPRPYSDREQIIIDLYKNFFINDTAYLSRRIITGLQAYLDRSAENPDLLTYINNIIINAALCHQQKKSSLQLDWTSLLSTPKQQHPPLEYNFSDPLGKRIGSALLLLKAHHHLAAQEEKIAYKVEQVTANIQTLETQYKALLNEKDQKLQRNRDPIEQQLSKKETELMATYHLEYRSSSLLLLRYLEQHGALYLQNSLRDNEIKDENFNRLFGHTGSEFHKAHIPPPIHNFLAGEDIKSVLGSTAPTGYFSNAAYIQQLLEQDAKEQNTYFIDHNNRFARWDTWLRQLYQLIEQQFLTINYELRPKVVEAIGAATITAIVERVGKPTFISGILASYSEFIGRYIKHQIGSFTLQEQGLYLGLYSYIKRILYPTLMKYPATDELLKIMRILTFIYEGSAIAELTHHIEDINRLAEELNATVYNQTSFDIKTIATLFSNAFDLVITWNFYDTSNNKYEVFLAKNKDVLLDWLNDNLRELSHPAINKRHISIIDNILEQFFQQFSEEYTSYKALKALPVFQDNTGITSEHVDYTLDIKQQRRKASFFQGTVTLFNSNASATTITITETASSTASYSPQKTLGKNHAGQ